MAPRIRVEDLTMSRLEKLCSDIRMISDDFEVEIIHRPDALFKVKIQVTDTTGRHAITGGKVDSISTFCSRRGFAYIILALDGLTIEIL